MITLAWLVLRIVYALFFLYPIKGLVSDWQGTKQLVRIIIPYYPGLLSVMMIGVMIVGALGIGLGIYPQLAAILLFFYCLFGVVVHDHLAALAQQQTLSQNAHTEDRGVLHTTQHLAVVGNQTSAQKNVVLAAVAFFFILLGSGPCSITPLLW